MLLFVILCIAASDYGDHQWRL